MPHRRLVLLAAWAALIFAVSSLPNPPGTSGGEWKSQLAHFTEYAILAALALAAARHRWPRSPLALAVLACWAAAALYGMSDEFHQSFVPNRDANWLDVGFDTMGAAAGLALTLGVAAVVTGLRVTGAGTQENG